VPCRGPPPCLVMKSNEKAMKSNEKAMKTQ